MNLERLRLYDFRNISELDTRFSSRINILYGENAQGKSNILEAIHYLTVLKPTRASREIELIRHQKPLAFIKGAFNTQRGAMDRQITLRQHKKKEIKEGENLKTRWSELTPLASVYFSPEDLNLVKGEPSLRRNFLDHLIFQLRPAQYRYLQNYYKVLSHRNALLKEIKRRSASASSLDPWDEQLAQWGSLLTGHRLAIMDKVSANCKNYYSDITRQKNSVELMYKSSIGVVVPASLQEIFLEKLRERRREDIARSYTTVGPHRDDVDIILDEKSAKSFASQGQQRLLSLCLRFAQRKILFEEYGDEPILLLDDVMSELDLSKRRYILEGQGQQVFITTTDIGSIPNEILKESECFLIQGGSIR